MLVLKIGLQILTIVLVLLTSTLDYVAYDKRTQRFKRFRVYLYVAAGLLLIISLLVTIFDDIDRRKEIAALRHELNRSLHRIEDVGLEFSASLQIDQLAQSSMSPYLNRVLPIIQSLDSQNSTSSTLTIPFISKSTFLPEIKTERVAYTFLSHVCIGLEIFIDPIKADTFINSAGHTQGVGDLVYLLSRSAGQKDKNDVFLSFDLNKKQISLFGANAKTGPSTESTGRIVSILDLAGTTAVIYFCPKAYQDEKEKQEFLSIGNNFHLSSFGINFSGGRKIFLRPLERINRYGERVYVLKFPETPKEIEALIQK